MWRAVRFSIVLAACTALWSACSNAEPEVRPPDEGYVEADEGIELYYRVTGFAPDTVVVVHGGPGLHFEYLAPDLEHLAEAHTLIFYDQRGGGRSTLLQDTASLQIDAHIADLETVRRHFGIDRLTLLGHSWGALLAARYAREHPERVARLIKISPGPVRMDPYDDYFFPHVTRWMDPPTLAEVMAFQQGLADPAHDARATCRAFFGLFKPGYFYDQTDTAALERMRGDFCAVPDEAIRNIFVVNALTLGSLGDFDWRDDFRELHVPVLVITGVRDVFPVENFQEWETAFPDARLVLLDGAGHYPHVERPEAFFATLSDFLR